MAVVIEETKDLGYKIEASNRKQMFGIDISDVPPEDGVYTYKSTNMGDISPKSEPQTEDVNFIDELGVITVNKGTVTTLEQTSKYNSLNPVHKFLNDIYLAQMSDPTAGTNVPYAWTDVESAKEAEGKCNILVSGTLVAGDLREFSTSISFVGGVTWVDTVPEV